jgi:hypothetical protein
MCFPIIILWNVRISLRKKLILSCTFGLVALTIAVTIVRGSVFGGTYRKFNANEMTNLNPGWMWFWIFVEFVTGKSPVHHLDAHITHTSSLPHRLHYLVPSSLRPAGEPVLRKPEAGTTTCLAATADRLVFRRKADEESLAHPTRKDVS